MRPAEPREIDEYGKYGRIASGRSRSGDSVTPRGGFAAPPGRFDLVGWPLLPEATSRFPYSNYMRGMPERSPHLTKPGGVPIESRIPE